MRCTRWVEILTHPARDNTSLPNSSTSVTSVWSIASTPRLQPRFASMGDDHASRGDTMTARAGHDGSMWPRDRFDAARSCRTQHAVGVGRFDAHQHPLVSARSVEGHRCCHERADADGHDDDVRIVEYRRAQRVVYFVEDRVVSLDYTTRRGLVGGP